MKKSICIISFSPIYRDARVLRQIEYLAPHYALTIIGYGAAPVDWQDRPNIRWMSLDPQAEPTLRAKVTNVFLLGLLGKVRHSLYENWYWRKPHHLQALKNAIDSSCDAFLANDWEALPIAGEAARVTNARLVFDAHEYAPLEFENYRSWMLFYSPAIVYFLHKYAKQIERAITVAPLIAARYRQEFNIDPIVIINTPSTVSLPSRRTDPDAVRLVHHGVANRDRKLEIMIETLALCDVRYTLHFMLINNDPGYVQDLKNLADRIAAGRVMFHEPIAPAQIVQKIAEYDIGFCLIAPSNYNYLVSLPNKFFDFIAAGLAICIGPSPSMREIVERYGIGCVSPTFTPHDLAESLNRLSDRQIAAMRHAAREATREFSAENEMRKLGELFGRLFRSEVK